MKFTVYEVWTRARVIDADDEADAYNKGEPAEAMNGMNLCNWHVVPHEAVRPSHRGVKPTATGTTGGLNYRQV